jgi:hypothetical protein
LQIARRDSKQKNIFYKALANAQVYSLAKSDNSAHYVKSQVGNEVRDYIVCFSNLDTAKRAFKIYSGIAGNNTSTTRIKPISGLNLLFSAAKSEMPIYLNPKGRPSEAVFLSLAEVKIFLSWALKINLRAAQDDRSPFLERSKKGRKPVEGKYAQFPISVIDFAQPFTAGDLADIFGVSENDIIKELANLETKGMDMSALSITLDEPENGRSKAGEFRYYENVVTFHIGYQIQGPRGDEFRRWHSSLLLDFCVDQKSNEAELAELKGQLADARQSIQSLETALNEKNKRISELEAAASRGQKSLQQLSQAILRKDKQIAELQSDHAALGEWLYPETVAEACEAAQARYGSRLVFHERVSQTVSEFSLNNDLRAAAEAVKMFKALAECLYNLKFERDNFSEEQFQNETGIPLSMTESRASKRDKAIEDTRVCFYNGRKITFYPHLKRNIQGTQMRLHFQFLSDERKILICHLGEHLPNAKSKYLS